MRASNTGEVRLLVGPPGVGKSTIVRQVVERLGGQAGGIFAREVREGGERQGFEIVTLDNQVASLSSKQQPSPYTNGRPLNPYTVNLDALEQVAVPALLRAAAMRRIVVIDEIGAMQLLSERFQQVVWELLDSELTVFGTIVQRPDPIADRIKAHPRVRLIEVSVENRDRLTQELLATLAGA